MIPYPYINIHSHALEPQSKVFTLRSAFPWEMENLRKKGFTQLSVGLHPWHVHREDRESLFAQVENCAYQQDVLAIGEAGLDRFAEASLELQMKCFTKQIQLTERVQKPLIIHCVRCFPELLALKKQVIPKESWIIHGFNGNSQIAKDLIRSGCYLSFGAGLLKKNAKLSKAFQEIPLNRIFLETDESPQPIESIYEKAADLRNLPLEKLLQTISDNFRSCFSHHKFESNETG